MITVKRFFKSSTEKIFDTFMDPALAGKFMFVTKTGQMVKVEIQPKVGGTYLFTEKRDGEDVEHVGKFLSWERPHAFSFSLQVPKYSQDRDRVTIALDSIESGTELTLNHFISPKWEDSKSQIEAGWKGILEGLAEVLGEEFKKSLYVEKLIEINAPASKVWDVLKKPEHNTKWISSWWPGTYSQSDWKLGSPVNWMMQDGSIGSEGRVTVLDCESVGFSFKVKGAPFKKEENLVYWVRDMGNNKTKLTVWVGDFSDSPEHEACYAGAEEAWSKSLPIIKSLAETI